MSNKSLSRAWTDSVNDFSLNPTLDSFVSSEMSRHIPISIFHINNDTLASDRFPRQIAPAASLQI